MLEPLIVCLQ